MATKDNVALVGRPDYSPSTSGRIAQVFLNVDLRNSHDGLMEIARKRGVDISKLEIGHYVVFINDQKNRFKLFAPSANRRGFIVAYYKSYDGRIDRQEIEMLPQAFGVKKRFETSNRIADKLDETLKYQRVRQVRDLNP